MNASIQNHSMAMEQRVNDYMRPFHTASCQEHLIGALQQLPRSPAFLHEESSLREQVALRLLQEVIVMGAQEQEALDDCLVACGPLEALSACASTLQEIAARSSKSKQKKKKKKAHNNSSVDSPSILETALRTIRRWLVKGVSFPPHYDPSQNTDKYDDRCWVERVTASMSHHPSASRYNNNTPSYNVQVAGATSPKNNHKDIHAPLVQACLESLTKLVLLFPVQIANACHALQVQLPSWAIGARYNPRLIEGALSMALYQEEIEDSSYSASYFRILVQHMVRSRNPDDVALGLYKYHERHFRNESVNSSHSKNNNNDANNTPQQPKALCQILLQLHRHTLSPRESAYLLRSIMISSIPRQSHATKIATAQLATLWQRHLYPYMELSCRPILVASRRVREAFVRLLVLSPSSVLTEEWPDRLLCHCVASLMANPEPLVSSPNKKSDKTRSTTGTQDDSDSDSSSSSSSDDDDSSDHDGDDSDSDSSEDGSENPQDKVVQHHMWLAKHVQEVIATWSMAVFVRQTDYRLQRHVTNFLLSGMSFLQLQHNASAIGGDGTGASKDGGPPMSDLVSGLLEGVTVRLESSTPAIRKDGMMIAERLAQKMGQELQFEELEQERTLAEDDEVTFLQSVMTASEFPSRYLQETSRKSQQPQSQSQAHIRQQSQQEQQQPKSNKKEKKSSKRREKEERRKRRKAKQDGKSDTRILDAIYGHIKSSSQQQQTSTRRKASCQDSYEDSYADVYGNDPHKCAHGEPVVAAPHQPRSSLHGQMEGYQQPPMPSFRHEQQRKGSLNQRSAPQQSRQEYDSFDNSSVQDGQPILAQESQLIRVQDSHPYQAKAPPADPSHPYHAQAPVGDPAKYGRVSQGYDFSQQYGSQWQQPSQSPQHCTDPPHNNNNFHHLKEEQINLQHHSNPQQHGFDYRGPEAELGQGHGAQRHASYHKEQKQHAGYVNEPSLHDDEEQRVTFDNRDYVIPEPKGGQQSLYWQNQAKQQRRQQNYHQQQAVERQLQKQHQQQKKSKEKQKEREELATLRINHRKDPRKHPHSTEPAPDTDDDEQHQEPSTRHGHPRQGIDNPVAADDVTEEDIQEDDPEEQETASGINDDGQEEEEVDDDDGIAACWTQNEVEMVLENDLPQHSGSSPRHGARSPRHASSPRHAQGRSGSPRKIISPQRSPQYAAKTRPNGRGKDVPTLIFAMVEEEDTGETEVTESSNRDTKLESHESGMAENRIHTAGISKSKLAPSPCRHNNRREPKLRHRSRKDKRAAVPLVQASNHKESLNNVRDRHHPQVDPAEIDARILAAAYDHESAASTTSAPSLSVYSSSSSDFSLYLGNGRRRRNGGSQRAIAQSKQQPYANAYQHMKAKKQQQRHPQGDTSKHRSPILSDGRTPKSPNRRVLMVDPDAAYISEDEEGEDFEDYDEDDDYEDDDCSRSTDDEEDDEDEEESSDEDGSYSDEDDYDDEDSAWDETDHRHLNAYDVEDDEEDLLETPKPRYLRDCLEHLRTPETDDHAYSKHESALKWLPHLVQANDKPADLPDLAVPLALELMRMENKFNMDNFADDKLMAAIALMVEEPLAVGQRLILLLWEDIAFMDRLDVLTVLSEAAFELSGNKELEEWHKASSKNTRKNEAGSHGKRAYVKENYSLLSCKDNSTLTGTDMGSIVSAHGERALGHVESKTRRWGRGLRRQESHTLRSRFGPVAHVWYYSLVGGFLQRKDNPALWGGNIGARLLANLFVTLATIVECAGVAPGTDVLAKDLFELVWSFRTVDVAEVRMGVLVAVAASLSCLSEEVVLTMMFDGPLSSLPEGLQQMSQLDPDESCRRLASSMARGISGIVDHSSLLSM